MRGGRAESRLASTFGPFSASVAGRRDRNARMRSDPQPSPALGRCGLGGKAAFRRMAPPFNKDGFYGLTATMNFCLP